MKVREGYRKLRMTQWWGNDYLFVVCADVAHMDLETNSLAMSTAAGGFLINLYFTQTTYCQRLSQITSHETDHRWPILTIRYK